MIVFDSTKTYLYHDIALAEIRAITGTAATLETRELLPVGGGGLTLRNPVDEFTGTTLADCRAARNTHFNAVANAAVLLEYQENQHLAIILNPTNSTENVFETYEPGNEGTAYDNTKWLARTGAVAGNDLAATLAAQAAAEAAQLAAETAETNAETAETNAETAQTAAETAKTGAETAQTAAEAARLTAQNAAAAATTENTDAATQRSLAEDARAASVAAQTASEAAQSRAEDARDGAATTLENSGTALAFHDFWDGDIDLQTANQWNALGTESIPSNATWLLWNGGKLSDGDNDGPAALWTWINAADWRALTADTVDTTPGDGTGMLLVEWAATDIGDGSPDFVRRDSVIGRTSGDIPLITGTNTAESYFGASLKYITQAVSTPGGTAGASSFSDLTGMIADSQVPDAFTRDTELAVLAALAGATFTGATGGIAPVNNSDFVTLEHFNANTPGGGSTVTDDIYFGTSADSTPEGSELTIPGVNGTGTIEAYVGNMYHLVARLATEADITRVVYSDDASQTNQIGCIYKICYNGNAYRRFGHTRNRSVQCVGVKSASYTGRRRRRDGGVSNVCCPPRLYSIPV